MKYHNSVAPPHSTSSRAQVELTDLKLEL